MKTPEQQVFGPVTQAELHQWLNQGRISAECQIRPEEQPEWASAGDYFGVLRPPTRMSVGGGGTGQATNPYGTTSFYARDPMIVPHRGGLILVLGILGWVFTCPVLAVAAWVMGVSDLREMRYGRMDPSGMGLTQAGQILGMVCTLLWLGGLLVLLFAAAFMMIG
jgi:hypothetical protein